MTFHIQDTDTVKAKKGQSLTSQGPTQKMTGAVFLFLGVAIGINVSSSMALRLCYNCNRAAASNDCDKIVKCGYHEECYESKVISGLAVAYNSGCMSKSVCVGHTIESPRSSTVLLGKRDQLVSCMKCCDSDFCNVGLCGGGTNSTSLRCFGCGESHPMRVTDCDRIEQCSLDAMCYAHRILQPTDFESRYEIGCLPKLQCEGLARAPYVNQCFECCDTHMCNFYKCGLNWTAVSHSTNEPVPVVTTPTISTELETPVISGLTSLDYHGRGVLNCMSNTEGVTYKWEFNGSSTLPPHVGSHGSMLQITNMTESEVGKYTCVISKTGAATSMAYVQVTIKEAPADVVSVSSSPKPAVSGKELNLHCEVTGYPVPAIYWSFVNPNGQQFVPFNVTYPSRESAYIKHYVQNSHGGTWTCVAINKFGNDTLGTVVI